MDLSGHVRIVDHIFKSICIKLSSSSSFVGSFTRNYFRINLLFHQMISIYLCFIIKSFKLKTVKRRYL